MDDLSYDDLATLDVIIALFQERCVATSLREIGLVMGRSHPDVHRSVWRLANRGYVRYEPGFARTIAPRTWKRPFGQRLAARESHPCGLASAAGQRFLEPAAATKTASVLP